MNDQAIKKMEQNQLNHLTGQRDMIIEKLNKINLKIGALQHQMECNHKWKHMVGPMNEQCTKCGLRRKNEK